MKMSGAEIIIKSLEKHGIDTVAGIPGGAALPIYNALYTSSIRHVLARHEQGACPCRSYRRGFPACARRSPKAG